MSGPQLASVLLWVLNAFAAAQLKDTAILQSCSVVSAVAAWQPVDGMAALYAVLGTLQDSSLKLMQAAGKPWVPFAQPAQAHHNSKTRKKLQQQEEQHNERQKALQAGLSWQSLAAVLQVFTAAGFRPSREWCSAAAQLALAYATAPHSNAAAIVPTMLQLLLAAGVAPSRKQFQRAAAAYLQELEA